jgi:3-oxoacyl-(acyl-carrier-protein) synthase
VELALPIITANEENKMTHTLKLASGFGGCNASLLLKKVIEK